MATKSSSIFRLAAFYRLILKIYNFLWNSYGYGIFLLCYIIFLPIGTYNNSQWCVCIFIVVIVVAIYYIVVWMNLSLGTKTSRQRMTELASCPPTRWDDIFSVNLRRNHGTAPDQDVNLIVAMAYNWRRKCNEKKLIIKFSKTQ